MTLRETLKITTIVSVVVLGLIAILAVRELISDDVSGRSLSTIGIIFLVSFVSLLLERIFAKNDKS